MRTTDISKCKNETCESKQKCWRYLAPINEHWQAFAQFDPDGKDRCEYFINAAEWQKWEKNVITQ
jgi:hypothetical protein